VFSTLEPCRTYSLRWREASYVQSARRKCLFLYYYFMDREFGLIHVRIQTWFPMQIQVYVNGHEWLARKLTRHGIRYAKQDNVFLAVDDYRRAQTFADRFASLDWRQRLDRLARSVNPLLPELLARPGTTPPRPDIALHPQKWLMRWLRGCRMFCRTSGGDSCALAAGWVAAVCFCPGCSCRP